MNEIVEAQPKSLQLQVEEKDSQVYLSNPNELPDQIRWDVEKDLAILNHYLTNGTIAIGEVDLAPIDLSIKEEDTDVEETARKPCNYIGYAKKWWGLKVWVSEDLSWIIAYGQITSAGLAAKFGPFPWGQLIAVTLMAQTAALIAATGKCGFIVHITWAGVPKKWKMRGNPSSPPGSGK